MDWNSGVAIGLALIFIFVLYLIDKHNLWRRSLTITCWVVGLGALAYGLLLGYLWYANWRTEQRDAAEQLREKPYRDCIARNSQFSNADQECHKNPAITLVPLPTQTAPASNITNPSPAIPKPHSVLGQAVVIYGNDAIYAHCNFDANGCIYESGMIATLNKGDRVQILSHKVRAADGTDTYEVRFQQWTGWMDATSLQLDTPEK